jgi:hypothetical protein
MYSNKQEKSVGGPRESQTQNKINKSSVFWGITPCSLLKVNPGFGGTFWLHLQGCLFHAAFFFGLLFSPQDGDDMFL